MLREAPISSSQCVAGQSFDQTAGTAIQCNFLGLNIYTSTAQWNFPGSPIW